MLKVLILHVNFSPFFQEYEFSPKSKLISVKEGTEEVVDITANR